REFSGILYDAIIPKVLYTYWDGSVMSFLEYLTIVTFKEHNPDYDIVLYMSETYKEVKQGVNYLEDLLRIKWLKVRKMDFEKIGFKNDISESIKSDYLRYWLLANYGGIWSD